jgi:hypothetical protein
MRFDTRALTAFDVRTALRQLQMTYEEAALELGVSPRSVRRWEQRGVKGAPVAALNFALRMRALGLAWRRKETSITIGPRGQILELTDVQAVLRKAALDGERVDQFFVNFPAT